MANFVSFFTVVGLCFITTVVTKPLLVESDAFFPNVGASDPCAKVNVSRFQCPENEVGNVQATFADPENPCSPYFFQCEPSQNAVCKNCPWISATVSLVFHQLQGANPPTGYCDWPTNVPACSAATSVEPSKTTATVTTTTVTSTSTTAEPTSTAPQTTSLPPTSLPPTTNDASVCAMPNPPALFGAIPVLTSIGRAKAWNLPNGWWAAIPNVANKAHCLSMCCASDDCITAIYVANTRQCHISSVAAIRAARCSSGSFTKLRCTPACEAHEKQGYCNSDHHSYFSTLDSDFLCSGTLPSCTLITP